MPLNGKDALKDFKRFPKWMWRNTTMPAFVEWLRNWNQRVQDNELQDFAQVLFLGMDFYNMNASIHAGKS